MSEIKKKLFYSAPVQTSVALAAKGLAVGKGTDVHSLDGSELVRFREWLIGLEGAQVLELGTRRTSGRPSTLRRSWVSPKSHYVACDFESGLDVDLVADAERLTETVEAGSIDAIIACSVFEHIRKPWLAAEQMGKALRSGGRLYVQTHHTYPLHAYPYDYWRFSREAMETLFSEENGFRNQTSWYEHPASILAQQSPPLAGQQAFLNVCLVAEKA